MEPAPDRLAPEDWSRIVEDIDQAMRQFGRALAEVGQPLAREVGRLKELMDTTDTEADPENHA